MRCRFHAALILASLLSAAPTRAEVVAADASGFVLRQEAPIAAPRARVYRAFVGEVGKWWNPDHTLTGNAEALVIDARPLGCFCEMTGNGTGMVHMTVTLAAPPSLLRLTGGLGPLGLMGVSGNLTVEFNGTDVGSATGVVLNYAVGGYAPDGLEELAPAVDEVLADLLARLEDFIETGSPGAEPGG